MSGKQTTLTFPIRKKSSYLLPQTKYQSEKENEVSRRMPTRRTSQAALDDRNIITTCTSSCSDRLPEEDSTLLPSSPSSSLTPSKRKINGLKEHPSPPKNSCLSNSSELTPSTRLTNITLSSPENKSSEFPTLPPGNLPPKELFPAETGLLGDEIRRARLALHTSSCESLPGREKELAELNDFLLTHIENGTSGSMYISGPPGTGKTACLNYLTKQKEMKVRFQTVYINCTSMKSPGALYSHIASQLKLKIRGRLTEKSYLAGIEKYLTANQNEMKLFILDELDQLESRGQSVLYTIFEWPVVHQNGLLVVGIANALDLTDRTLPRLRARPDLAPRLLHFAPYSRNQIVDILKFRLEEAGVGDVFSGPALQMLASKVATVSGDVRRALDIGRRVIEMAGNPFHGNPQPVAVKQVLKPSENKMPDVSSNQSPRRNQSPRKNILGNGVMSSPAKTSLSPARLRSPLKDLSPQKSMTSPRRKLYLSPTKTMSGASSGSPKKAVISPRKLFQSPTKKKTLPTVDLKGVMSVVGEVYGSAQSIGSGAEELPLHQKVAVCSLLLIIKNGKSKDVTVGKLHEVYRRVCNKKRFDPLDQGAFLSMLNLIEARGLLLIQGKGKPGRLSKVSLQWVEDEVISALKDRDLYASILKDVACLS